MDTDTHRCPDNGARVDISDCSVTDSVGAAELKANWQDPDFDPDQHAFYYVRGLENPTCRWSTWDAIRAGVEPHPDLYPTIQERIWSSPIWITPSQKFVNKIRVIWETKIPKYSEPPLVYTWLRL